jgi:hemoglobin
MKSISRLVIALILTSIAALANAGHRADGSLYKALGGQAGVTAIVDQMLLNISDDTRIVHYFADANIANLRHGLITQFCDISGGPCHYTGLNVKATHRGLHITAAAFNALVEDLRRAMKHLDIPIAARNRLLAKLVPMRNQIVEPSERD